MERIAMSKLRILAISIMVLTAVFLAGSSCFAAEVKIETHRYSPIAPAEKPRAVSRCIDPLHPSHPKCKLVSWALQTAEEDVHKTAIVIRDIKIKTPDLAKHIEKKDLEKYLLEKIHVQLRDVETNSELSSFHVVSVSGLEVLRFLIIPAGHVTVVSDIGLAHKGSKEAVAYVQTNIHVVYAQEKKKKSSSGKGSSGSSSSSDSGGSSYEPDLDDGDDTEDDDAAQKEAEKRKEAAEAARKKAQKEKMKKLTAQISPKERENDTQVAQAETEENMPEEGPDNTALMLLAGAVAAAAVFGYFIRSDLRLLRWYKQKKALKKQG